MQQQDQRPDLQNEQLIMSSSMTIPDGNTVDELGLKAQAARMFIGVQELRVEVRESTTRVHGGYKTYLYDVFGRFPR